MLGVPIMKSLCLSIEHEDDIFAESYSQLGEPRRLNRVELTA